MAKRDLDYWSDYENSMICGRFRPNWWLRRIRFTVFLIVVGCWVALSIVLLASNREDLALLWFFIHLPWTGLFEHHYGIGRHSYFLIAVATLAQAISIGSVVVFFMWVVPRSRRR